MNRISRHYTLVEMMASIAIFGILLVSALQFFQTSRNIMTKSAGDAEVFENSRVFFEILTRDLHALSYSDSASIPFWCKPEAWIINKTDTDYFSNQAIAFVSNVQTSQSSSSSTECAEIKYTLWCDPDSTSLSLLSDSAGWVMRSETDSSSSNFNYVTYGATVDTSLPDKTFTADNASSDPYNKLIPYAVDLSFQCYSQTSDVPMTTYFNQPTPLPYSIFVTLTLLDRDSWAKWTALGGLPVFLKQLRVSTPSEPEAAKNFRLKHQRTFTKMILIGKREL